MKRKAYEAALRKLQVELCAFQEWVKQEGLRVVGKLRRSPTAFRSRSVDRPPRLHFRCAFTNRRVHAVRP